MRVTVEPEALAKWSAHARRTADRLAASLTALETGLAPLVRTWRGEAGEGFGGAVGSGTTRRRGCSARWPS